MRLKKARIENFRSIEKIELEFDHGTQVLIGINESGKSNVLRALQLLDPAIPVKHNDLRQERKDDKPVSAGLVRFEFELEPSEVEAVAREVRSLFDPASLASPVAVTAERVPLDLDAFVRARASGLYEIEIPSGKRRSNYWMLPKGSFIDVAGWHQNATDSALDLTTADNRSIKVPPRGFFYLADSSGAPTTTPGTVEQMNDVIGSAVRTVISKSLPKCIAWQYRDEYLLPSTVDIATFGQNPDSCIPLKSMFELAGYAASEIATVLANAKAHSPNRYMQVLDRVATSGTKHVRAAWKDHKNITIRLQPDGAVLVPAIVDEDVLMDMTSRSDGFKRFVSFLLQVSAKVRTKELSGVLLLIDEPEIALHPGGARSLTKELIDIGTTNTVVYSTHSIFMIDRDRIDRHLIVEKKDEITRLRRADASSIQDEEVLYAAMGYSVFETLKQANVIFEGWKDRELFRIVAEAAVKGDKSRKAKLDAIGITFAEGVKDVKNVARFMELAGRGCLIISDSDQPAQEKRREYMKQNAWGKWLTLSEVMKMPSLTTAEDLIAQAAVIKRANKFKSNLPGLGNLTEAEFQAGQSTIATLRRWMQSGGIDGKDLDQALSSLKEALFENLKRDDLIPEADLLVSVVLNHDFNAR